jgi:Bromodomain
MPIPNSQEREIAEKVLATIRSEKYKARNYLFLEPFDLSQVPGYLDKVEKPLDLLTISNTFDTYSSASEFWKDLNLVFQNAISYHGDKAATKWIAKFAKDMLKAVSKERKSAENPNAPKNSSKLKIKLKSSSPEGGKSGAVLSPPKLSFSTTAASAPLVPSVPSSTGTVELKKPKLKLKVSAKPKSGGAEEKIPPKKAKPTQPKLKLKLSLGGKKAPEDVTSAPPPPSAKQASSKKAANKAPVKIKIASPAGNRGKELPQGVTAAPPKVKAPKPKKKKATATAPETTPATIGSSSVLAAASSSSVASTTTTTTSKKSSNAQSAKLKVSIDENQKKLCSKVVAGLKRRKPRHITWFVAPITDKKIVTDYRSKIKNPMDLQTIQSKIDKNQYKKLESFVTDLRRVFANALRYNTSIKDSLRPVAVECLEQAEILLLMFVARQAPQSYQPLLYCWKVCIGILDTLYNLVNPTDGQPMAYYFLHPVSVYCGGKFPPDYVEKVSKPMDFGTVTANLVEGKYQTAEAFATDCKLVLQNCQAYYAAAAARAVRQEQQGSGGTSTGCEPQPF